MRPLPNNVVVSNLSCVPLLALLCCLFAAASAHAQTTLSPGDIAFTYGNDGSSFSFVLLVDVDSGTSISFDSNSGLGGDTRTWTASSAQTAGTVFTESGWGDFKKEGCYAYQGSATCSNVIAEFSLDGWGSYPSCNPSGGQSIEFDESSSRTYTGTRIGSKSDLLAALGNTSNWSGGSNNTSSFVVATCATSLFTEDFSNDSGTSGSSAEGVNWSSSGSGDQVDNNRFRVARNGTGAWTTSSVSVSDYASLIFSCDVSESGGLEPADNITIEVKVDGTAVYTYTHSDDDPLDIEQELIAIAGSNAVIVATATNSASNEKWFIDNVSLIGIQGCTDIDEDCICDDLDNCTDTSAPNYDDPANGDCQAVLYSEDFEDFGDNYGLGSNGSNNGGYPNDADQDWTLSGNTSSIDNWWVETISGNKLFEGKETDNEVAWTSPLVDVSGYTDLTFSVDLTETGSQGSNDYVRVYVKYDGGSEVLLEDNTNDFNSESLSESLADANTVQLVVRVRNDDNAHNHRFDNLLVTGVLSCLADVDNDGLCDDNNGDGCTNTNACNYADPNATSCEVPTGCESCSTADGNGTIVDNDVDNDGVCDADEVTGCTDSNACNFDDDPTTDTNNGLCVYATGACESCSGETDGTGTVVVTDSTDPTITPQGGITAFADGACEATGLALGTPATSDNCGVASVTNDAPSTYPLGVTTVTWTVTDTNGNTATATQTVTVLDNTAPTVSAANVESCLTGASISVAATDVISSDSDNCAVVTREIKLSSAADSQYASSLSFSTAGDYAVTVRVTDAAGLMATATATVSVTTGPTGVLYSEDFEDESTNSDLCSPVYTPSDNNWTPLCPGGTSTISTLSAGDEAFRIQGNTGSNSSVSFQVASGNDDAEESSSGSMSLTSSDLELVQDGSSQKVGIRFQNVTIPQGAEIVSAYIQFTVDETNSGSTSVAIAIEDTDNASAYSSSNNNISSRTYSSSSVAWNNIPAWNSVGASGSDQATPDLAALVQEVVGRGGWSSGNALAFKITGSGERTAESYNGESNSAPELFVEYVTTTIEDAWQSAAFDVNCIGHVLLRFDARSSGDLENSGGGIDEFDVYAVKDGTESLLFGVNGHLDGSSGSNTVDDSFSQGIALSNVSELSILIKARLSASDESYSFDDFKVCVDENDNGLCDVDECTTTTVTASAATVSLGTDGQVTVDGTTVSAGFAGDCFTPTSYEVSTDGTTYASSVNYGCSDLGGNTLYVRGTDGSSTTDAITVTVTVQDYAGPFAAFGNDIDVVLAADGTYTLDADDFAAIDNGSYGTCNASLSVTPSSFTCGDLGANEAVLTISDGANSATANITITVKDETAPNVTVLSSVDVALDVNGVATLLPSDVSTLGGTADACTDNSNIVWQIKRSGDASFSDQISVGCSDVGFIQVQVQATDLEGIAFTSGDINVEVLDEIAPVLSSVTVMGAETLDSNEEAVLTASDFVDGATDNCGVTIYEISDSETTGFASTYTADCDDIQSGGKAFYFRVRDASGNTSNVVSTTIVITENENPVVVANAITLNVATEGQAVSLSADNASFNGSSDNCSFTSLVKIVGSGADYASSVTFTATGTYSVTLQVTDPAGNSATSTAVVTVAILAVDGCIDPTACNYDASANTDDGTCHYPGQECQSPSAGQGFVYTVNTGLTGCDCTAQNFTELYSEPFDDEVNVQDPNASPLTYLTICTDYSANDDNWSVTCTGTGGVFVFPADQIGTDLDLNVFNSSGELWQTKSISVADYTAAYFEALVSDSDAGGNLDASDGWTVTATGDGVSLGSVTSIFDDVTADTPINGAIDVSSVDALVVNVQGDAAGDDIYMDDITVSAWGKEGCTDAAADNYDATAQVDDLSCSYSFTTAYSLYDGGFGDPLWRGTECGGDCGAGPFFDAKPIAALTQTSQTTFNYVISSGTKVTVDGTLAADDGAPVQDLFVRNLTIESGGELVIPSGKRLRIVGDFVDLDGNGITGGGEFCIDDSGRFLFCTAELNGGNACPTEVTMQNLAIAAGGELSIPEEAKIKLTGDLTFGATDPLGMEGLIVMSGTSEQTISGHGATVDRLQISNTAGVAVSDSLEIQGRLTLDASTELDMGSNWLVFASNPSTGTGEEEKTAVLDMIPATASLTGAATGGRLAQSANAEAKVVVERYIAADTDGVTFSGYTLFSSPIDGALVGDLDGIDGFYLAGWSDTDYPSSFATVLFWDEANSAFVEPTSNSQSLDAYGGAWIAIAGSQTPTMVTSGALNSHVENSSKTFSLTRTGPTEEFEGWNLVYNPYQARLDWDAVISNVVNAALIEDQYAVYDTQAKQFVRYSETNTELASAARCIEPGQSFWVRVKDGQTGGSLTIKPSMINNDGPEAEFVRSEQEGQVAVILETENVFGVTRSVLRFGEQGDADAFVEGDLSRLGSSSIRAGELAFVAESQNYIAKTVPMQVEGDLFVRSRANFATTLRVVEVTGDPAFCAHVTDHETGEVMLLQEGMEMTFTLPAHEAEEGRFTLHGTPFAVAQGQAPECEDSEAGAVIVELGDVVADLTVVDYATFEEVALLPQATGTVEVPVVPGEYAVHVDATEETSLCRGGRRQVVVFPGEQPELLGLEALPAECNVGEAALAFELYGGGEFQTSLWQGGAPIWQESLQPGEYEIGGFAPGEYVLKVDHTCLEAVELVSLSDPGMPSVSALYDAFVEVESSGGAWLEAQCVGCLEGDGFGYYWILDGDIVAEDEPLSTRVYSVGSYDLQLVAFGPDCEMAVPFEVLVGKHKIGSPDAVRWLGMVEDHLMAVFDEEWAGVQCRWYDSSGRLLGAQEGVTLVGEAFLPAPDVTGWLTLEVRSADGRMARWSGIR